MKFEKGDVITLDNEKDYVVMDIVNYNLKEYAVLITEEKPLKIIVCRIDEDNIVEIYDQEIIKNVVLNINKD